MSETLTNIQLYNGLLMAANNLTENVDILNNINVFPVADQDTGTNMMLTMKSAVSVLTPDLNEKELLSKAVEVLVEQAKGNSGTLLTLFFQGFQEALSSVDSIDVTALANGFSLGGLKAYEGISDPRPGTIITVASKAGETGTSYCEITKDIGELMTRIADEVYSLLPLTTAMNPSLEKFGVIDSGALGFSMIVDGMAAAFNGQASVARDYSTIKLPSSEIDNSNLIYPFCTEFIIDRPSDLAVKVILSQLESIGDCIIPAYDAKHLKVHVHTNKPDAVFFIASLSGQIRRTKVDNMMLSGKNPSAPVDIYYCSEDLTRDGLKSMQFKHVFMDSEEENAEFIKLIKDLSSNGTPTRLFTSVKVSGDVSDMIPRIRFFSSDDDLLDYLY